MRLLDRYLLRELLVPLGYCLGGFLLFWVAFDLIAELSDLQRKGLHARDILEFYLVTTPEFLVRVIPIALLLALLYTLTQLARYHEITAIRAAGVSLWRLAMPYFAVGLLLSLATFAINEFWAPDSSDKAEEILGRYVTRKNAPLRKGVVANLGFKNSRDNRVWQITRYQAETGEMFLPEVLWTQPDGSRLWLRAERGVFTNGGWVFHDASLYRTTSETNSFPMPVLQTNLLAMPQFLETPDLIRSEIRISNRLVLGRAKSADIPIAKILNYLRLHPEPSRADRDWLYTKLHGRFAAPWTCLIVVFIALPFGAASGRRNVFVGVASSIVICFIFFVLQQLTLALGSGGYLEPWLAAWLPNLSFLLAGLWMTASVR